MLWVIGCGELGGRVATRWVANGGRCVAWTRGESRHEALKSAGVHPLTDLQALQTFDASLVVFSVPGAPALSEMMTQLAPPSGLRRAVLCSSTVSLRSPGSVRGQRSLQTEEQFQRWSAGTGVVCRFGGLYRTGRGPYGSLTRGRTPPKGSPVRLLPLIHYEDAATAIGNALTRRDVAEYYTVVTNPVPTRKEFYAAACGKLGLPLPEFGSPGENDALTYCTTAMERDLLPAARYPDWRSALE